MNYVLILVALLSFNLPVVALAQESDVPLRDMVEVNSATVEEGNGEVDTDASLNPCWYRVADDHCLDEWDSCSDVCYTMDDDTERAACLHRCNQAFNACNR